MRSKEGEELVKSDGLALLGTRVALLPEYLQEQRRLQWRVERCARESCKFGTAVQ